jgi:flagellar biosynthesis chaperone FliJ
VEPGAWELLTTALTPEQVEQVHQIIDQWRKSNPDVVAVAYVRLQDFSKGIKKTETPDSKQPTTLVSALRLDKIGLDKIISLDPLKDLDPAVREITQTRQLAERTIYYAQRAANLIDMQVELLMLRVTIMPETQSLLGDVGRVSKAVESAGKLADRLPEVLAQEREAAIQQFMDALNSQQAQTRQLMTELRSTLEAGTATSASLTETIRSLDKFMARFDKPSPPPDPNAPPAKPFDINDYTEIARELGKTANHLQALLAQLDTSASGVTKLSANAASELQAVVDHAFWRGIQLILILVVAVLAAALTYRVAMRKLRGERGNQTF